MHDWEKYYTYKYMNHETGFYLCNLGINDNDIASLCTFLNRHPEITTLVLTRNNIGPKGAQLLAANNTITCLYINYNHIGSSGAQAFAKNTKLQQLNANFNSITTSGRKALQASNIAYFEVFPKLDLGLKSLLDLCVFAIKTNPVLAQKAKAIIPQEVKEKYNGLK